MPIVVQAAGVVRVRHQQALQEIPDLDLLDRPIDAGTATQVDDRAAENLARPGQLALPFSLLCCHGTGAAPFGKSPELDTV